MRDRLRAGQKWRPSRSAREDLTGRGLSNGGLREAWSEWLLKVFQDRESDLVTLTFAPRPWECDWQGATGPTRTRVTRAAGRFEKFMTTSLGSPSFFMVREFGGMNGRAHLHSIVWCEELSSIRAGIASHAVRDGFVKLSTRIGSSASEYVTKYLSKSDGDFWRAGGPLFVRVSSDSVAAVGVPALRVGRAGGSGEIRMDVPWLI